MAAVKDQDASRINTIAAAMPECYHWPFGREENGVTHYLPYDPYASLYGATDAGDLMTIQNGAVSEIGDFQHAS